METRSNQVLVGSVVLALIAALALFVVWLSGVSGSDIKQYDIFFKQSVEGLARGSSVSFSGVPSGQITEIALWERDPQFVRVRVEVREETPILQGTTATISGVGFTGVSQITLDGAVKGAPPIQCPAENSAAACPGGVPVIPTRAGGLGALLSSAPQLLERVSTLTERLSELLSDENQRAIGGILANTDRLSDSIADRGPEIAATLAETRVALQQAGIAIEKIGNLADSTNGTLNGEAKPLIADLRRTVQAAGRAMNTLDATIGEAQPGIQAFTKQTLPEVGQLVRDLRATSETVSSVAARLDQGGATGLIGAPRLPDYQPTGDQR